MSGIIELFQGIARNWNIVLGLSGILTITYLLIKRKTNFDANKIVIVGVMTAMAVLMKQFSIQTPLGRLELVHIVIIIAGMLFGPITGLLVGLLGDMIGATLLGYSLIPFVFPIGYALVGLISGFIPVNGKNKTSMIVSLFALFVFTNFVIEYITYITFFEVYKIFPIGFSQRTVIYYSARLWRLVWQLPIFIVMIPMIYKRLEIYGNRGAERTKDVKTTTN